MLPFTLDEFLDVFRRYNDGVWPMQWLLTAIALVAIVSAFQGGPTASRLASVALSVLWVWMGAVYHLGYFRAINPAAPLFGVAFIAEGLLLAWLGLTQVSLRFEPHADAAGLAGLAMILYALLVYPLLGRALGHRYPYSPTFGAPCPTTIFTFGIVLLSAVPRSRLAIVIPVLWSFLGAFATLRLGMWEDAGLVLSALIAALIIVLERPHHHEAPVGLVAESG